MSLFPSFSSAFFFLPASSSPTPAPAGPVHSAVLPSHPIYPTHPTHPACLPACAAPACLPAASPSQIYGKAEFLNPGFSIKDRIARNILEQAEKHGLLKQGMTVVAASSGNTGAATAMMCAMRGYDCIITTSSKCSEEKMNSIRAYGATLLVTPAGVSPDDPQHYMNVPHTLIKEDPTK